MGVILDFRPIKLNHKIVVRVTAEVLLNDFVLVIERQFRAVRHLIAVHFAIDGNVIIELQARAHLVGNNKFGSHGVLWVIRNAHNDLKRNVVTDLDTNDLSLIHRLVDRRLLRFHGNFAARDTIFTGVTLLGNELGDHRLIRIHTAGYDHEIHAHGPLGKSVFGRDGDRTILYRRGDLTIQLVGIRRLAVLKIDNGIVVANVLVVSVCRKPCCDRAVPHVCGILRLLSRVVEVHVDQLISFGSGLIRLVIRIVNNNIAF